MYSTKAGYSLYSHVTYYLGYSSELRKYLWKEDIDGKSYAPSDCI